MGMVDKQKRTGPWTNPRDTLRDRENIGSPHSGRGSITLYSLSVGREAVYNMERGGGAN